jgi:quercetin dioxygenase-like cupin family protein
MAVEERLYQLIGQPKPIVDRRLEVEFLDAGVETSMRRIAFLLVAVVALAGVVASMALLSGQVDGEVAPKEGQPQAGAVAQSRDDLASKLARREVQRSPSSIPGREIVQVETLIPAGVESGWHTHPGEEVGYIIAGQVEMKVQGHATVVRHAGDGFLIPPRTPHNARDLGPETGRMLSTYIVETGQPIAKFADQPVQR